MCDLKKFVRRLVLLLQGPSVTEKISGSALPRVLYKVLSILRLINESAYHANGGCH